MLAGLVLTGTSVSAAAPAPPAQQRGVTLWGWTPTAYGEPPALRALDAMRAVGADGVTVVPVWFQPTRESAALAPDPAVTTRDAALTTVIRAAHARGMRVTLKPQLDVTDGSWRGAVRPRDLPAWFTAYSRFLGHYAALAQREQVEQLVVGTELAGVSGETARWTRVVAVARGAFHGSMTYAALPFEYRRVGFWWQLDLIGVNAYWELTSRGTTDVAALVRAWRPHVRELAAFAAAQHRRVLLTEAGYASQAGTASRPSSWTLSRTYAPQEQAAAYEALLRVVEHEPWCAGVHWWAWRATNRTELLDFTPQGKPAEAVLRAHWR